MKNSYIILFLSLLGILPFAVNGQVELVKDTWTTNAYGGILTTTEFTVFDGKLFFAANDGGNRELWVSDGTELGTHVFKEINPSSSSSPTNFYTDGNLLFFSASNGSDGSEPFVSDGTVSGTFQLKNINTSGSSSPFGFIHYNGEIYFSASTTSGRSSTNNELWKTDGTSAGTVLVKEINSFAGSNPREFTVYNNKLYFIADDGTNGDELWSTDGTEAGTTLVKDIHPSDDADISELTVFNNKLYFSADDGSTFDELWCSDGTSAGTTLVKDISPSSASAPYDLIVYDNALYFSANDGTNGYELWKSDGTEAGTVLVKDIHPSGTSGPQNLHVGPNALYFTAQDGVHNKEIWKTDGTEAGTLMVKDIRTGSSQSNPSGYTTYNGKVYFLANDGVHGSELWVTDGTGEGTVLVEDIWNQNTQSSNPLNFVVYNNTLLFSATNSTVGRELFKYNSQVTWNGSRSTNWHTPLNWNTVSVPTASDNVLIFTSENIPFVGDVEVNSLTINSDAALTVTGNITTNEITMESGGSLIAQGTVSATFTQKRTVNSTDWHLISVPLSGETVEDLRDNHPFATGSGTNVGIGAYLGDGWSYYTSSSTGSLTSAHGIAVKLTEAQDITFTGSMETDDLDRSMLIASSDMNLLGNPYPSYLAANASADGTNNILTVNSGVLTEQTLWFWNPETNSYDQVNQATSSRFIEPGEGFFVSTSVHNNLFSFTELMQNHQPEESEDGEGEGDGGGDGDGDGGGGDDFLSRNRNTSRSEIQLQMKNETEVRKTDIFYIEGTTTGFDNGFDSTIFIGSDEYFQIYTHHVADGYGEKLGIQSIPNENFQTTVVPIGIKASEGTDITISATTSNLPSGVYAYLEDKERDTFTLLDDTSQYHETLSSDLDGIGRFYLHTSSTLGVQDESLLDQISVYQTNHETLRIVGIQQGEVTLNIHNILGQNLVKMKFVGNGTNDISLPELTAGLYIITLESLTGSTSKKIVIR